MTIIMITPITNTAETTGEIMNASDTSGVPARLLPSGKTLDVGVREITGTPSLVGVVE